HVEFGASGSTHRWEAPSWGAHVEEWRMPELEYSPIDGLSDGHPKVIVMNLAVEAKGLVKQYRSRAGAVDAVRGVDLTINAGEIFGFLGPNGAGKSTTIRMLTTLMSITSGTAHVAGIDVAAEPD